MYKVVFLTQPQMEVYFGPTRKRPLRQQALNPLWLRCARRPGNLKVIIVDLMQQLKGLPGYQVCNYFCILCTFYILPCRVPEKSLKDPSRGEIYFGKGPKWRFRLLKAAASNVHSKKSCIEKICEELLILAISFWMKICSLISLHIVRRMPSSASSAHNMAALQKTRPLRVSSCTATAWETIFRASFMPRVTSTLSASNRRRRTSKERIHKPGGVFPSNQLSPKPTLTFQIFLRLVYKPFSVETTSPTRRHCI